MLTVVTRGVSLRRVEQRAEGIKQFYSTEKLKQDARRKERNGRSLENREDEMRKKRGNEKSVEKILKEEVKRRQGRKPSREVRGTKELNAGSGEAGAGTTSR
jgi:hypothetical protein